MRHCSLPAPTHTYTVRRLVSAVAIAKFVGVERRAAAARERTDQRALPAADQAAEQRAAARAHRDGQLIAVLLPEATTARRVIVISRPRATGVARPHRCRAIDDARSCRHITHIHRARSGHT